MKTKMALTTVSLLAFIHLQSQAFDMEEVKTLEATLHENLKSNPLALEWLNSADDAVKSQKFNQLMTQIGTPPLGRSWSYPNADDWPLINWNNVESLDKLFDDQFQIINTIGIVANDDEDAAKLATAEWLIDASGKDMQPWFEKWITDLSKSEETNKKRLALWSISQFAEDIRRGIGDSDQQPIINWNVWEEAFNQSDELGKAIILVCIKDLCSRVENYDTAKTIHETVFSGTNDALKAIALYQGSNQLGEVVKAAWQDIAENHDNSKLKALAQQAIALWSGE